MDKGDHTTYPNYIASHVDLTSHGMFDEFCGGHVGLTMIPASILITTQRYETVSMILRRTIDPLTKLAYSSPRNYATILDGRTANSLDREPDVLSLRFLLRLETTV